MVDNKSGSRSKAKCAFLVIITVIAIGLIGLYIYYQHDPAVFKGRIMITGTSNCLTADDKRIIKVEKCNVWHNQ